MEEKKKLSRINGFLEREEYVKFKIKLLHEGKSFNQWLREKVKEEIDEKNS